MRNGTVQPSPVRWIALAAVVVVVWLGVNAVWGLTGSDLTLGSGWEAARAPLAGWLIGVVAVAAVAIGLSWASGARDFAAAEAMLLAYLIGVAGSRWLYGLADPPFGAPLRDALDPLRWVYQRSFLLLPALPMLAIRRWHRGGEYPLRWGDWRFRRRGAAAPTRRWPSRSSRPTSSPSTSRSGGSGRS